MSVRGSLLLDNSAWARMADAAEDVRQQVAQWIRNEWLVVSLPFLLEAGYSARSARDHRVQLERLLVLPYAALDAQTERLALDSQGELVQAGQHRLPPVDLLIAALAHRHGYGILHCDRHYDLIARHTALEFESVYLEPG